MNQAWTGYNSRDYAKRCLFIKIKPVLQALHCVIILGEYCLRNYRLSVDLILSFRYKDKSYKENQPL